MEKNNKINCTVGILTYNSEKGLLTCLESVRCFSEIIIADGGSTDKTLKIAKQFNAKIVAQSNPGHPIEDFSKERQILLDNATSDWFFYLDSDEIATIELIEKIREITEEQNPSYLVYRVKYQLSSPDFSRRYISYKSYYQTRFFNKKIQAHFIKKMHERITFDKSFLIGTIEYPWLVPLEDQLDFKVYKRKVDYRLGVLADRWAGKSFGLLLVKGILPQIKNLFKQLFKMVVLRIREKKEDLVPFKYEIYRLYSPIILIKKLIGCYFCSSNNK